jgi:ABC-type bacteriocin/lantibiotic exporter with double-glycine peptidase domain
MLEILKKLVDLLDRRERRRALVLLAMILIAGFVESVRVASIVPFVAVIADASVIQTNPYLALAYNWLDIGSTNAFLIVLGLIVFAIMLGGLAFSALTNWAMIRFVAMRNYRLSSELFKAFISRPYEWFLGRHSADLGQIVLSEVNQVVGGSLMPFVNLTVGGVTAAFMVTLLLIADPLLAVIVSLALGGGYAMIYWGSRRYLKRIGEERVEANRARFRISGEAFSGIKDVKVRGLEKIFISRFEVPSRWFATHQAASEIIGQLPQYGLQALAFSIVLVIVAYQLMVHADVSQALPVIALYALAGSRLMPAMQKIYQAVSKLRYNKPALDALHRDLIQESPRASSAELREPLGLRSELKLKGIFYRYPGSTRCALQDVAITLHARNTVGIVGQTGAGKTTLVDVILGLLEPEAGSLTVDDVLLTPTNLRAWQDSVGYVPQHIFLADDTIAMNIAFGVAPHKIDMSAVERAARIAALHDFVTGELEQGYATLVGERGIRLSGGQRQRVGIARALYHDPDLLIMDEGTSALDSITERAVMDAVANLARRKTIILIAHRMTTVRGCDTIYLLEHGQLVASGTYDALVKGDKRFRAMAANPLS